MAVLSRAALIAALALAGCYRPELQDCTVTCAAAGECASGQVCDDGWCVAPAAAGTCGGGGDDGGGVPDAEVPTIDATPDAAGTQLHVVVEGRGKVVVTPLGVECVGTQAVPGDCFFPAPADSQQTLLPVETSPAATFAGWTTANCAGNAGECTVTIDAAIVLVGASFQ